VSSDIASRGALTGAPESRSYPARFEVRKLANGKVELQGYASTFEQPYTMYDMFGEYSEKVRSGAFGKTITDNADVAYLSNHEGLTMARTASGSLRLSEDSTGLMTVATVNTARTDVRDLVTAVEDGDVDQMSFGFRIVRQEWSPDYDERALVELNLDRGDVSAVNFGANPATSVSAVRAFRSMKPAKLQRMAIDIREGNTLDTATLETLSRMVAALATDEEARSVAPKPAENDAAEVLQAAAYVETLRLLHEHDQESRAS